MVEEFERQIRLLWKYLLESRQNLACNNLVQAWEHLGDAQSRLDVLHSLVEKELGPAVVKRLQGLNAWSAVGKKGRITSGASSSEGGR
jgi:hypothetical protein